MPIVLFLLFIVVPVIELAVILQVGDWLGLWPTLALLIGVSIVGAWLVRREGARAWLAFRNALDHARMPHVEVIDGALLLLGGALMLTPGFVTDAVGLLLVVPVSRAVVNRLIRRRVAPTLVSKATRGVGGPGVRPPRGGRPSTRSADTIDVEVVDVRRDTDPRS